MRMRKKRNLLPRLERAEAYLAANPQERRGKWLNENDFSELYLELGCGKGRFTCEMAKLYPDKLFIGIERVPDALVIAAERAMREELTNVLFIANDARILPEVFTPNEVSRIYINFCDPWPGKKRAKRRLTSETFLPLYRDVLPVGGEIRFKTDNVPLFDYTLETLPRGGFEVFEVTRDLHNLYSTETSPNTGELAVMTNYEEKFHALGTKINRLVAVNKGFTDAI